VNDLFAISKDYTKISVEEDFSINIPKEKKGSFNNINDHGYILNAGLKGIALTI
jgi:hypothetical protein